MPMNSQNPLRALLLATVMLSLVLFGTPPTSTAQLRSSETDSLIIHSLEILDLPSFEWQGAPEPLRPRIGIYLTELPPDSIRAITGKPDAGKGFRAWHVMPHWPADEAGMLIGDILLTMNG